MALCLWCDIIILCPQFSTPAMTEESEYVGVPVTFLSYMVECTDEKTHYVELYYDNTAEVRAQTLCHIDFHGRG